MDLIPDIPIPTQNKLIPDPILTPAKSGINTALIGSLVSSFVNLLLENAEEKPGYI